MTEIVSCLKTPTNFLVPSNCIITKIPRCALATFNGTQLREIAKLHHIKTSGRKKDLYDRIVSHINKIKLAYQLQKLYRRHIARKCDISRGPALKKRSMCTNDTDFYSGDTMISISPLQFFSYTDDDGFTYGFDIVSIMTLIAKACDKKVYNPYSRIELPTRVIMDLTNIVRCCKIMRTDLAVSATSDVVTNQKALELRALTLFQFIDSLGNYSNPAWLLDLPRGSILIFMRELADIWHYRAQLTMVVKASVCPPFGDPFRSMHGLQEEPDKTALLNIVFGVLEEMVTSSLEKDHRALGAYYVLAALTLVNPTAALALPWLHQSVA